jgi:LAO/AO transport system kinase
LTAQAAAEVSNLAAEILRGDARAAARGMSLVENGAPEAEALLESVYGKKAPAPRIGITGPPGAGKSTLVAEYARLLRGEGLQVGVVAVDPTSPFTGGAILGDRVRMGEHATDAKVFIRSMATRGSLGGLAARTGDLCEILDGWGSQITLVETVGVGQSELDVAEAADTVAVVLTPESGDAIQALKAGLMEIADVIVLNKADHVGADAMEAALRSSLAFRKEGGWRPPIVRTVAIERKGLEELHKALLEHRAYAGRPEVSSALRREKTRMRLRNALREELLDGWLKSRGLDAELDRAAERVLKGEASPHRAVRDMIERMNRHGER